MSQLSRALLDTAVSAAAPWVQRLSGRSIHVTGASGFLASNLICFLLRLDQVYDLGLTISASSRRPPLELPIFKFLGIEAPSDWRIASIEQLSFNGTAYDTVVHTASYGAPRDYMREPITTFESNTAGLLRLFHSFEIASPVHLVYFSSSEVYGQPSVSHIPTPETYCGGLCTTDPRSIYSESKRMAEVLGTILSVQRQIPFTILRPWHIYGPGQRINDGRVPMDFVRQGIQNRRIELTSDGSPLRSFCYVWDGIAQIAFLLGDELCQGPWNIGNGDSEVTILDTATLCAQVLELPRESVHCDLTNAATSIQRCCPNVEKILAKMNLYEQQQVSLSTGIQSLIEWVRFVDPTALQKEPRYDRF